MKQIPIKKLIRYIVNEALDMLESHEQGEWYIDNSGNLQHGLEDGRDQYDLMQNDRWKKMKASKNKIDIVTYELKAEDLHIILQGIGRIMSAEDASTDPDTNVKGDGFAGPRVNIKVLAKTKNFNNVPLGLLKQALPSNLINYEKGKHPEMAGPVNEDFHHLHKEYRLFEGNNHIYAIFEDGSRLVFEVHYHNKHGEDREKWRRRAFTTWKSVASKLHSDVQLNEVGNPVEKTWKQCFEEALKDPKLKEFIRTKEHAAVFDSVNFTPSA